MSDILFPTDTTSVTPATGDIIMLADVSDSNNLKETTLAELPISTATQTALDGKQGDITLTTTGTSGPATLIGDTLNIPQYSGGGGGSVATDAIWDAKGDLAGGTGANTASRLPVGTNGQVLTADSAEATGLKWSNPAGGGDALTSGTLAQFASTTSAQLAGVMSDETGSGSLVFGTSPTLTTPRFADLGFIADSNGNEMLAFNQNASAVNYIELENGTTTNPPHLRAKGDDTNIGLHLVGKGTGEVSVCDGVDETKRMRFNTANNGTGIITTLRSNSTGTSKTIDLPNATDTLVGRTTTDTLTNKTLTTPVIASVKGALVADTDGATITFDKNAGTHHSVTLGGNRTLALSNMATGDAITLRLQQDGTGSRIPAFTGATIKWAGGSAPTFTTTPSKADVIGLFCTSAGNYDGYIIGQNI